MDDDADDDLFVTHPCSSSLAFTSNTMMSAACVDTCARSAQSAATTRVDGDCCRVERHLSRLSARFESDRARAAAVANRLQTSKDEQHAQFAWYAWLPRPAASKTTSDDTCAGAVVSGGPFATESDAVLSVQLQQRLRGVDAPFLIGRFPGVPAAVSFDVEHAASIAARHDLHGVNRKREHGGEKAAPDGAG